MPVKFKRLTEKEFDERYPGAAAALEEEFDMGSMEFPDAPYGEIKIPGYGWHACIVARAHGEPAYFYSEDEGWTGCPRNQPFEEV